MNRRILIVASLVLSCRLCLAKDFPQNTNEIKSLTAEQAADLVGKFEGENLWLNYLNKIDKDVAQELAMFKGGQLGLCGLTSMEKDVAKELAKFKGSLYLRGLASIDKDAARKLGTFRSSLDLQGLTSIDKDVAKTLGKFKGEFLALRGLASINKDVAKELAKFKGTLFLGLTSIDKDVAMNLGKFKGKSLWLIKLTSIDKDVAQELGNFRSKWAAPDALVQASAHLHQAMKPLDELLFRSKSGVDWRAYLYWPWLEAQAAAGQNLDVNVLRVLYSRFNANENGLEMYQFVTVRRSLAAAIVQAGKYKNRNEGILNLSGLTSIDEVSLTCLRSNTAIFLPEKYRD